MRVCIYIYTYIYRERESRAEQTDNSQQEKRRTAKERHEEGILIKTEAGRALFSIRIYFNKRNPNVYSKL